MSRYHDWLMDAAEGDPGELDEHLVFVEGVGTCLPVKRERCLFCDEAIAPVADESGRVECPHCGAYLRQVTA